LIRSFSKDENILMERSIMSFPTKSNTSHDLLIEAWLEGCNEPGVIEAFDALCPNEGSRLEKYNANAVEISEDGSQSGICLNFSRINHDCVGNSSHTYIKEQDLMVLVANTDLPAGSEVTFSYVSNTKTQKERVQRLCETYNFVCTCAACENPIISAQIDEMAELDERIFEYGAAGEIEEALQAGKSLLSLYGELKVSSHLYARTYYDMFQIAICKRSTLEEGLEFIRKAVEADEAYFGPACDCAEVNKKVKYAANPESHRNYLVLAAA